jgi:uncharacterized protein (TIGR00255 family)
MIRSMTGYARLETQADDGRTVWEMRAVNHRYLDLVLKLPEEFRTLEADIRSAVGASVARGKVELSLRYGRDDAASSALMLDSARLTEVQQALDAVGAQLGASAVPDPLRILQFPGVVRAQQPDFTALIDQARAALPALIDDFNATRSREGERLAEFLLARATELKQSAQSVAERFPQVRDGWLDRLRGRCLELGVDVEPARLAQELALAASRLDVAEELSRLDAHLTEVHKVLRRSDAVGRRLDFLMQELNREANTLSSKSQDAEMTRHGVDMKVLIEQMREQVQNVE